MRYPKLVAPICALLLVLALLTGCPRPAELPANPAGDHWLRFVLITDTQIVDSESPARAVRVDPLIAPSWRPHEIYGPHVLDATCRAINTLDTNGDHPIDFVLFAGDAADNAQLNELRWFIDIMDGQSVVPDSGEIDGPERPGDPELNPFLAFQPEGLTPSIPWYTVYGNHDGLGTGVFQINRTANEPAAWTCPMLWPVADYLGLHLLDPPTNDLWPLADQSPAILQASTDLTDPQSLQLRQDLLEAGPIAPDTERAYLSRQRYAAEMFGSLTSPVGHGLVENAPETGQLFYTVRPAPAVPLRLIVLDTVAQDAPYGLPFEYGVMRRDQFEGFLKSALEQAQADGEHVIVVSHHPSSDFSRYSFEPSVSATEFRLLLLSYPNVVAHLCGHTHRHQVVEIVGENAYLEIETASLMDYPQQGRVLDVFFDETTSSVTLQSDFISHMSDPTPLSEEGYRRAALDLAPVNYR